MDAHREGLLLLRQLCGPAAANAAARRLLDALDRIPVDEIAERAGLLAKRYLRSHPGLTLVERSKPAR